MDAKKDLKQERLGAAESVNAIKDGKIDAFFWVGGLPTAAVTDLANTPNTKLKMIDHADAVAAMNRKYGNLYVQDVIPKDTYRGMTSVLPSSASASIFSIGYDDPSTPMTRSYDSARTLRLRSLVFIR